MEPNNYLFQEAHDLTQEMVLVMYGPYAATTTNTGNNQFQPAGQEYMQDVGAGSSTTVTTSTIRDVDVDLDPSAIPRTSQPIYYGMEPRHTVPNILNSDFQQPLQQARNSDRASPPSSDGQVNVLPNYELYNPSNTSTSSNHHQESISDFPPSFSGSTPRLNENVEAAAGSSRPAIKQHFWIQRTQITPTKALNCHVREAFNNGVITFFCAWPGCTHPIGFAQKAQVITHVRSAHLQEKPYVCTTCNTTFARKQDANRHVVSLNRGKQYRCSVCHRAYSRRHYRNEHEERCLLEALSGSPEFEPGRAF